MAQAVARSALAAASHLADRHVTAAKLLAYMQVFFWNISFFRNDDPFKHKTQMVCTRLRAKFRHRTTRRFGGDRPQTE